MRWTGLALAVGATMLMSTAAVAAKPATTGAENGLLGIKLYDPGTKVVGVYGTPDEIQAVGVGAAAAGGGNNPFGGGGGGGFGPRAGGGRGGGGSPGPAGGLSPADVANPFAFGDSILQAGGGAPPPGYGGPPSYGGGNGPSGFPGAPGNAGGGRGGFGPSGGGFGPGGGGGTPPRGNGGAAETAQYTRWVYNRQGSKYAFIIDKFGRVVQIEAIGLQNNRVKTRRGIGFGATFAQLIKTYKTPDGYEIAGDNVMVKFLSHSKVAFRLTRLGEKKPQVVTGIVVAAAKG